MRREEVVALAVYAASIGATAWLCIKVFCAVFDAGGGFAAIEAAR